MARETVKLQFFLLDVDYSRSENAVRLFGVTQEKKHLVLFDRKFLPYFYAVLESNANPSETESLIKTTEINYQGEKISPISTKIETKKLLNSEVKAIKIFLAKPEHIPIFADAVKNVRGVSTRFEFDIKFYRRYLIDKKIEPFSLCEAECRQSDRPFPNVDYTLEVDSVKPLGNLLAKPSILAFDIETLFSGTFPNPTKDSIVSVSFYGSGNFKRVIAWKRIKDAPDYINFVDGEAELLEEFAKIIKQISPEILVGYGSDNFDFPFLHARAKKYNINLNLNWDGSEIMVMTKGRSAAKIRGIVHIDLSHFARNVLDLETERFKLDLVAKELLGKGKADSINISSINEIWSSGKEEDIKKLFEYNLVDAQLTYELAEKILPTEMQLIKLLGLPLFDINRMTYGQLVEWYLIKNATMFGQLVPRRPRTFEIFNRRRNTYEGAFVVQPSPGFYKNVAVFDFRSLYPTIIASHNIGPDTINCKCCEAKSEKIEGYWFCMLEKSFYSSLIHDLIERRRRINEILRQTSQIEPAYKELLARQHALKYVAVSFYGYLGFAGSRWYSLECAKSITALGRKYIQTVIKEAEKFGFTVLYGDTDSMFVISKIKNQAEVKEFAGIINSILPKPMELEYREFYPAALFLEKKSSGTGAKKRYALLTEAGNILLRGVEAVRGDWSLLAKNAQRRA
ncbi:MAG: ribonuclease H-like domain-containing protein, partial [DPANN group archaeon]|nr:ribonuclease H-like domain-containing protein [DPANN group archaeon]